MRRNYNQGIKMKRARSTVIIATFALLFSGGIAWAQKSGGDTGNQGSPSPTTHQQPQGDATQNNSEANNQQNQTKKKNKKSKGKLQKETGNVPGDTTSPGAPAAQGRQSPGDPAK
jgi:hypothetical protein